MKEHWKPFCHGYYEISNKGRVYSVRRDIILSPGLSERGYALIITCVNYKRRTCYIHRLVARKFISKRPNGMEINHQDLNKDNNRVDNLEYISSKENHAHAHKNGYIGGKSRPGEENPRAKLREEDVEYIRKYYVKHENDYGIKSKLARRFGITNTHVGYIVKYKSWK
jgi:hypothetical protein